MGGANSFQREVQSEVNCYRQKHGVPSLSWNKSAGRQAQRWAKRLAKKGKFEHSKGKKFGENLAMGTDMDAKKACKLWYDEIGKYQFGTDSNIPGTGHFTAMVWKSSTGIGVGRAVGKDKRTVYIVANFSPPGNVQGRYKENVPPRK